MNPLNQLVILGICPFILNLTLSASFEEQPMPRYSSSIQEEVKIKNRYPPCACGHATLKGGIHITLVEGAFVTLENCNSCETDESKTACLDCGCRQESLTPGTQLDAYLESAPLQNEGPPQLHKIGTLRVTEIKHSCAKARIENFNMPLTPEAICHIAPRT